MTRLSKYVRIIDYLKSIVPEGEFLCDVSPGFGTFDICICFDPARTVPDRERCPEVIATLEEVRKLVEAMRLKKIHAATLCFTDREVRVKIVVSQIKGEIVVPVKEVSIDTVRGWLYLRVYVKSVSSLSLFDQCFMIIIIVFHIVSSGLDMWSPSYHVCSLDGNS